MAFQFILGDLIHNKKSYIIRQLLDLYQKKPNAKIYYIVPEHLKFEMESYVLDEIKNLNHQDQAAMINIQVASFTRLLWFLEPQKKHQHTDISSTGLMMLVQQLLMESESSLKVFRGQIKHQGFAEQLAKLFDELYQGNIQSEDLNVLIQEENQITGMMEHQRIRELMLLYEKYIQRVRDLSIADYQVYEDLHSYLQSVETLENHYFVIDHYYYFNAHQLNLVMDLAQKATYVGMMLPVNEETLQTSDFELMYQTFKDTYQQITLLCQDLNITRLDNLNLTQSNLLTYHDHHIDIANAFKNSQRPYRDNNKLNIEDINQTHQLRQYDHIQSEVKHVSNQIHQCVALKGYRYQDILVVTRDMALYQQVIPAYFSMNAIPYFYDHEMEMASHPFVQLIEAWIHLKKYHGKTNDLMTVLRSVLISLPFIDSGLDYSEDELKKEEKHRLDLFENALLKYGFSGYRFFDEAFKWNIPEEDNINYRDYKGCTSEITILNLLTSYRDYINKTIFQPLLQLPESFTGQFICEWLMSWIEKIGIKQQFIHLRDQAIDQGNIELSRRHEQVWDVFCQLLDEYYLLFGNEWMDFEHFSQLLTTGLNEATFHIIPPTLDQVVVSNMESPITHPYKICFVLGLDDTVLPKTMEQPSLLSFNEREVIQETLLPHQVLRQPTLFNYSQDAFLMYQLLLNATDYLSLSFSVGKLDQTREPSIYLKALLKETPLCLEIVSDQTIGKRPLIKSDFGEVTMNQQLIMQLFQSYEESSESLPANYLQFVQLVSKSQAENQRSIFKILNATRNTKRLPYKIDSKVAMALYQPPLALSVSTIEQYYKDPYSHFLQYGLKLRERELYTVDSQLTGDYFHDVMEHFIMLLMESEQRLSQLSDQTIHQLFNKVIHYLNDQYKYNIFTSQPRFQAIQNQLNTTLQQFIQTLKTYDTYLSAKPLKLEAVFGQNQHQLKGRVYSMPEDHKLWTRGKIDRLDVIETSDGNYLSVIDYKSSQQTFKLTEFYEGLNLQIMTYLDIALLNYPDAKPLGGFYQTIRSSFIDGTQETYEQSDVLEESFLNKNRLTGIVTVDEETLKIMDHSIQENQGSAIFPVNFKKNGEYNAYSSAYSNEEFQLMRDYLHYLIETAGKNILSGEIKLAPYHDERYTASLMYPWRVIAGFDPTLHYHAYREKTSDKKAQLFERMENDLNREEGNR